MVTVTRGSRVANMRPQETLASRIRAVVRAGETGGGVTARIEGDR